MRDEHLNAAGLSLDEAAIVLELAVNGNADAIVTFNGRDFAGVGERFGVVVLTPRDALTAISHKSTPKGEA